jgi:site-specific DNA recombinase
MFGVRGLFAAYEKAKIAERFRIGKVRRVKDNQILTTEAPYGYTYVSNIGKRGNPDYISGHYEINEYEAEIVRKMFDWIAYDGLTLRGIVNKLKDLGIKPRKSKRGVWNTSTLSTLFRNETYIGLGHWGSTYAVVPLHPTKKGGYRKIEKSSRKFRPKDKWYTITVPAIITKEVFDLVALKLKKNFEALGRNKKNKYLLVSKIYCTCGHRRTGEGPQKGKHLYYRCTDRVYSFPLPRTCLIGGINARIVDEIVWQRVREIMTSPDLLAGQIKRFESKKGKIENPDSTIDIKSTEEEINKLQKQEDRYADAFSKGVINVKKFEEYVAPIREKISVFENQISLAKIEKNPKNNEIIIPDTNEIQKFCSLISSKIDYLSFEGKQAIIRTAVEKITASRESLQAYGLINLHEIYVMFLSKYRNCRSTKCWEINAF